jgi:hypothetical protein
MIFQMYSFRGTKRPDLRWKVLCVASVATLQG